MQEICQFLVCLGRVLNDKKKSLEVIIKITRHCHFLKTKDSESKAVILIVTFYLQRHSDIPLRKETIFNVTVLKINIINFHIRTMHPDIIKFFIHPAECRKLDYSKLKFTLKCSCMFRLTNHRQGAYCRALLKL